MAARLPRAGPGFFAGYLAVWVGFAAPWRPFAAMGADRPLALADARMMGVGECRSQAGRAWLDPPPGLYQWTPLKGSLAFAPAQGAALPSLMAARWLSRPERIGPPLCWVASTGRTCLGLLFSH